MRKTLKKAFIFVGIILITCLNSNIYASSFKITAKANTTTLKAGETVEITLTVSDIDVGDLGMNALEGYIEYDENIFEPVTQENVTGQNGWSITYNSDNGKFLGVLLASGVNETTVVGTVKLKVKSGIQSTSTTVKFVNIATNDGVNLVEETDKTVNLTIGKENETQKPSTSTPHNEIIIDNSDIVIDETSATGNIPQAGNTKSIILLTTIIAIIVFLIKIYSKYKNIDR